MYVSCPWAFQQSKQPLTLPWSCKICKHLWQTPSSQLVCLQLPIQKHPEHQPKVRGERVDTLVFFLQRTWAKAKNVFREKVGRLRIRCCNLSNLFLHLLFADVKPDPQIMKEVKFWCCHMTEEIVSGLTEKHTSSQRSWPAWPIIWKDRNWENLGFKLTGATTKQFNKQHAAASRSPKTHHENIHATFCDEWRSRKNIFQT